VSTLTASDDTSLMAALASAQGGDTIALAGGSYAALSIKDLKFAQGVIITSADPGSPAVITGILVKNSSGFQFTDLEVLAVGVQNSYGIEVNQSQDVHFTRINLHGSLDGNAQNDPYGFLIRNSSDVSIADSEMHQLGAGVAHLDSDHLTVTNNYIHDVRMDGMRGGGSSWVLVDSNRFANFFPATAKDHGDAIQFWTTNTTTSAHDIVITNNVMIRGAGAGAQGIYLNDEVGNVPYRDVVISGNLMIGGHFNGIAVFNGDNVAITDNIVAGYPDFRSWISIERVTNATMTGNSANQIHIEDKNIADPPNAILVPQATDQSKLIAQWLAAHPGALLPEAEVVSQNIILGTSAPDTLTGGVADDTLSGANGLDYIRGGDGADSLSGGADFDDLNGNAGDDTVSGGAGNDWVLGGKDNDSLTGDGGVDFVNGNLGNDTINGGDGSDVLRGGQGDDVLIGAVNGDWLSGDRGSDTMTGGALADTFHSFVGTGLDLITDFNRAEGDRLQLDDGTAYTLSQVDADTHVILGDGSDKVILQGVQISSLTKGWVIFV